MARTVIGSILLLTSIVMTNGLYAKGITTISENRVKEKREISNFKNITISGSGNLYIIQGNKEALVIEGVNNILSEIKSEVKDNHLFLGPKDYSLHMDKAINYHLTVKNIQGINTSGSISVFSRSSLVSPELNLTVDGSGKADIKVKVKQFNIKIAGNGNIKALGTAQDQIIEIKGDGEYNGKKLPVNKAVITINGSGTAEINVLQELAVKINGFGKVKYYGRPKITQEISGAEEIIPL